LYRPETKSGDPRLWIHDLKKYSDSNNLITIVSINNFLFIINVSKINLNLAITRAKEFNPDMVAEVMQYGYINAPYSAFNEIGQLPPASLLTWREGKTFTSTYWVPDFDTKVDISYKDALETTKELIEESVARRLVSERPLGSFLSGGYDSTIVTAYMAKLMSEKVQTYSIGFHSAQFNEAHHAKQVANYLGTNHHEEILNPDPALVVEKIAHVLDQPFADSSVVPTYLLAKFARENLIVALGGDGGDDFPLKV
jgi:asparagine synthase (glutamine-hydrolysing)